MENLILKHGALVRALTSDYGLVKGRVYSVASTRGLGLAVESGGRSIDLVNSDGTCFDACYSVVVHRCPIELPKGSNSLSSNHSLELQGVKASE